MDRTVPLKNQYLNLAKTRGQLDILPDPLDQTHLFRVATHTMIVFNKSVPAAISGGHVQPNSVYKFSVTSLFTLIQPLGMPWGLNDRANIPLIIFLMQSLPNNTGTMLKVST